MSEYISVGWCVVDDKQMKPIRTPKRKQWYGQPSPTPAKIYVSESVAKRYGIPKEVFIKAEHE